FRRLPGRRRAEETCDMHGAGESVLMESVAKMRAAEPRVARALHRLDARLRRDGGMVEHRVLEPMRLEGLVVRDRPFGIERDEYGTIVGDALEPVHPVGDGERRFGR